MIEVKLLRKESDSWIFLYNSIEYKLNESLIILWNSKSDMIAGNTVKMLKEDLDVADR